MNHRKLEESLLPGAGLFDAFFDRNVQFVLKRRFDIKPKSAKSFHIAGVRITDWKAYEIKMLAWPIAAFRIADVFARRSKGSSEVFAELFNKDSQFIADMLAAVVKFHSEPIDRRSFNRRIAEVHNDVKSPDVYLFSDTGSEPPAKLLSWEELSERYPKMKTGIGPENLSKRFSEIKKAREKTLSIWQCHFEAYDNLIRRVGDEFKLARLFATLPLDF